MINYHKTSQLESMGYVMPKITFTIRIKISTVQIYLHVNTIKYALHRVLRLPNYISLDYFIFSTIDHLRNRLNFDLDKNFITA